jgi:hypothetical protein
MSQIFWGGREAYFRELDNAARDDKYGSFVLVSRSTGPVCEALHVPSRKASEGRVVEHKHGPCPNKAEMGYEDAGCGLGGMRTNSFTRIDQDRSKPSI